MRRIIGVLYSSFFALSAVAAQPLSLQALQSKLATSNSTWSAGETKVSGLQREDQKKLLGAIMEEHDDYFSTSTKSTMRTFAPAYYDWRSVSGVNFASPVLDQGRCGSCVAFAAVGQLETQMNITRKTPNSPWAFSPQHLFACGSPHWLIGNPACDKGWMPDIALQDLKSRGVPDEACFPYTSGATGRDMSCSSSCSDSKARSQKILRFATASSMFLSVDVLKAEIQKGPLMTTMKVYEDFMYYKSGVYSYKSGEMLGGHAIVIEGWSDADKAWIVRNSWGADWGENGYFRISWSDKTSQLGVNSWKIEVPAADGAVTLGSLRDRQVISGAAQVVQLESTYRDTMRLRWEMSGGGQTVAQGAVSRSQDITIDTTPIPDGTYQIAAIAERTAGPVRSQPRVVHVLNGALSGQITLDNLGPGETVSERAIMKFSLRSAPIPFTGLVFRAKNLATGQLIERRTPHVAAQIDFSWNTFVVDNGDWEVSLEGVAGTQSVHSVPVRLTVQN